MPFIIKLISENCYLIPDVEGGLTTTKSQHKAIQTGILEDINSANETAQCFNENMTKDVDYEIIKVPRKPLYTIEASVPQEISPRLKPIEKFINNGKYQLFLSNVTTADDAMKGITRYDLSTGRNTAFYNIDQYEEDKLEITAYLNERFGNQWDIKLLPVQF